MKLSNFMIYTTIGALVWNIVLAVIGYVAHGSSQVIEKYSAELSYIILGMALLFVIYLFYNGFIKKQHK